jgi:hypothetical protein
VVPGLRRTCLCRVTFVDSACSLFVSPPFSPTSNKWSGTWSRAGHNLHVVLTRPEPNPGAKPSAFVGDGIGESVPNSPDRGSLHIRESLDGVLSAWLDLTTWGMDLRTRSIHNEPRNGEWL